jgi:hypothetical protein
VTQGTKAALCFFFAVVLFVPAKAADEATQESRFITNARQLIFDGRRSGEGYFSPDGAKLIFQSEREESNPFYQMYVLDLNSGETTRVSPGTGKTTCGFFRPGTDRVIFASTHADPQALEKQKGELEFRASGKQRRYSWDYDDTFEIYSAKQDGTDLVNLTNSPGYDAEGAFSPDGQQIVFCSLRSAFPLENLSPEQRARYDKDPSWFGDIYIMNADGSNVRRLTDAPGYDGGPVFSPDGQKLCWTSGRTSDGKAQLFLADWNDEAAQAALIAASERSQTSAGPGTFSPDITEADLREEVEWLADPARDGRMTGTAGAQVSANWLADYFRQAGLQSFSDELAIPFQFNAGERVLPDKTRLEIATNSSRPLRAKLDQDFRPLPFSESGEASGEVVFAGYGLVAPGDHRARYDSYAGLDVKDKIVLILRYVPENVEPARRAQLNRYAGLRYKAMLARERGAKAVLVATGPNSPHAGELLPLTSDFTNSASGITAASINEKTADALLASSGKTLKTLQTALDSENPHVKTTFALPKVKATLACGIEHLKKSDSNVVAYIPPAQESVSNEYIVVGAHYDHLGHGGSSSLDRAGEENEIHPGADDNASGVAWVMEMAASLAKERAEHPDKFRRGIVFACWSGEEIGLIGSAAFCEHPPVTLDKVVAYVNADMVGRMRDNKLSLQGVGSSHAWRRLIEKRNVAAGFNLSLQDDPYLPTDVTSFYTKNVPVLNFFTGGHEDYHRPTDTADKLNYKELARITTFTRDVVLDLAQSAERPDLAKVERSAPGSGGREMLRTYLGTIPDYTTEVKGVKLSGVRGGSPAEKAGLRGGDVIVEFAGQKITNIYDYTYALDAAKIGKPTRMVVERDGKRVAITVTPEARK